tara:strand:- start:993 stop:1205 length:213 start_codon:yes stop_codon:yes gene_type:complete
VLSYIIEGDEDPITEAEARSLEMSHSTIGPATTEVPWSANHRHQPGYTPPEWKPSDDDDGSPWIDEEMYD